jgi:hypothetical protein
MARKCFMCGRDVTEGILCEKCDKPRKKTAGGQTLPAAPSAGNPTTTETPRPQSRAAASVSAPRQAPAAQASTTKKSIGEHPIVPIHESTAREMDPFPKAPVVPFPVESASPAITSVVNLLVAAGVPSILLGPDRSVKFISDDARRLFEATANELGTLASIEARAGLRVGDLAIPNSAGVRIGARNYMSTLVPLSGGASGAALIFRPADPMNESHASFATYVKETVFGPLRGLRDSMAAAAKKSTDPFLADSATAIDHILSSLELAPEVEEPLQQTMRPVPTVTDVVRRIAERFRAYADLKGIRLDVDLQDLEERFVDHEHLSDALAILMENALHYVPAGGQVVIGIRWMEHKAKPLLLFFVMDNGPVVPEEYRQAIFEPSFSWNPASQERTGRGLFKCREFAIAHSGSVWVESKTGKACTFFLRVRPDGVR